MNFKNWLILTEKIMIKDQEFRDPLLALQQIRKTHPNPENLAVTFTRIDKVGLNPKNKWKTPLGIYLYPIDYVIEKKMDVPFAGGEPHINVCEFTRPEKILHMNPDISKQDGMELLNVFPKEQVDQASENIDNYDLRSNYSKLWIVTRTLAKDKPTQWNINFRKCGIDGFVDHGTGTIHRNEPTQCVVFAANALKLLHSIDNPAFNKTTDKFGVNTYKTKTFNYDGKKMEDEQIIRILQSRRNLNIESLIDSATDKNKVVELILKYKLIISDEDIPILLTSTTDKEKIAEAIIEKTPELSNDGIYSLIQFSKDKQDKIAEIILNKILKLSNQNIENLLRMATDKNKIAQLIIEKKPELDNQDVETLLSSATDKDKIAKLLGAEKINKLSDIDIYRLLVHATNKEQMAKALGTDNISKLTYDNVSSLIEYAPDKIKMAQIINQYHTKKTPEIQELISKYSSGFFKRILNLGKKVISTGSFT